MARKQNNRYGLYIVRGESNNVGMIRSYIGKTTRPIWKRLFAHVKSKSSFGKTHKNVKILYFFQEEIKPIFEWVPKWFDEEYYFKKNWNKQRIFKRERNGV